MNDNHPEVTREAGKASHPSLMRAEALTDLTAGVIRALASATPNTVLSDADSRTLLSVAMRGLVEILPAGTLLKPREVAVIMNSNRWNPAIVYQLRSRGVLDGIKLGKRRLRFAAGEVRRFLHARDEGLVGAQAA